MEGRDNLAILLNVDTVVQSEGLGNLADGVRHGGRCGREMSREKSGSCERRGRKGGRRGVSGGSQRCGCAPNRGGGGRKSQSGQGKTGQSHWLFARGCGQVKSQLSAVLTIDTVCRDINWRSGVVDDGAVCRVMVVCLAMLQLSCACPCLFFFSREAELAVPPIHQTSRHRKLLCTII